MGLGDLLGGIRDRVSSGLDAVEDTVSDGVDAVQETVSDGVGALGDAAEAVEDRVTDTVEAAGDQFQAFAHDAGALALQARTQVSEGVETVQDAAQGVVDTAGAAIEEGGRRLQQAATDVGDAVTDTVRDGLHEAGRMAEDAGRELGELRDNVAEGVRDLGQRAVDAGERGLRAAQEGLEQAGEAARGVLHEAGEAARAIGEAGQDLLGRVTEPFDPATQIARLNGEGDSVSISLGGFAEAIVRGEAKGQLQVKQTADGYDIDVQGQVGLGLIGELGGHDGVEASASARGMLEAGGKVTLHASTREEAARMVRIAARMAAVGAAGAAGSSVGPIGTAVAGGVAQAVVGPSADDVAFMTDHMRSVEVRGGGAGTLAGELGVADTLNLEGSFTERQQVGMRIDFPRRNAAGEVTRGARLHLFAEGQVEMEGSAAAGVSVGGKFGGKVTLDHEIELPRSVTGESLLRDPIQAVRDVRDQARIGNATLTIEGEVQGGVGGSALYASANVRAGAGVKVEIQGDPADLARAGARAVRGDFDGALSGLDQATTIKGELTGFENDTLKFAPSGTDLGFGAGVEAQYQLHDQLAQRKIEGHPSEIARRIREHLAAVR